MQESKTMRIQVHDFSVQVMRRVLEYVYGQPMTRCELEEDIPFAIQILQGNQSSSYAIVLTMSLVALSKHDRLSHMYNTYPTTLPLFTLCVVP
jgi:hypothetical protein